MLNDIKRTKVAPKDVMEICEDRGKPEVHIHTALTFVWGGDPMALVSKKRDQKEIELGQFASRLKHGQIRRRDIEKVFHEFQELFTDRMRQTGCMAPGE